MTLVLAGCDDDAVPSQAAGGSGPAATSGSNDSFATSGSTASAQAAPWISGAPNTKALVDQQYVFQPAAADPNGDKLSFTITARPAWATFDSTTGRLSGTPTAADVRTYAPITIRASDGVRSAALQPFTVEVVSVGQRAISLSWLPPTQNEDGSPLLNLAGYRIRYGIEEGEYDSVIELTNPGLTAYLLDGLVPSTYHLVVSAFNAQGIESGHSNPGVVTLN